MDESFEIYKTFMSSTCHVEQDDLDTLHMGTLFSTYPSDYGIRIFLGDNIIDEISKYDFSEGLKVLVLFAVSNDCAYLELDSDGPTYDSFPIYDW